MRFTGIVRPEEFRTVCREPSWLENIELGPSKVIKRENIDPKIFSRLMALLRRLRSSQAVSHTHLNALGAL